MQTLDTRFQIPRAPLGLVDSGMDLMFFHFVLVPGAMVSAKSVRRPYLLIVRQQHRYHRLHIALLDLTHF